MTGLQRGYQCINGRAFAGNTPTIRAKAGHHAAGGWHPHDLGFQLVYILKGWVKFRYEGQGEVTLRPGSCVHQPPGIRHRELGHSPDIEMLEIVLPAGFTTEEVVSVNG